MENCPSCVKEPTGTIPIRRVIDKLNRLFETNDLAGAGEVLRYWEKEARALGDTRGLLEILSEEVGHYRNAGDKERGLAAVEEAIPLVEQTGLADSVSGATILLNCATTLKEFGQAERAVPLYERAKAVYLAQLPDDDFRRAGLSNNMAAALTELRRWDEAEAMYLDALAVLERLPEPVPEIAVTHVNLAQMYAERDPFDDRIAQRILTAYDVLEDPRLTRDGNYAYVCAKCAPAFSSAGFFREAKDLRERAEKIYAGN